MKHRLAIPGLLMAALLPLMMGATCSKSFTPIVFVHGGSGSGAQFESQAARFMTNGVPQSYIRALEYDSSAIGTIMPQVLASLDALIAQIEAETGKTQIILIGHSLGTQVSQNFLHCVNLSPLYPATAGGAVLCGVYDVRFKVKNCGTPTFIWNGALKAYYSRTWQEFPVVGSQRGELSAIIRAEQPPAIPRDRDQLAGQRHAPLRETPIGDQRLD